MPKLKIILLSNKTFKVFFLIALIYALLITKFINFKSKYNSNDNVFNVQIIDIYVDGDYLRLTLNGKEKLQGTYYFESFEEKDSFLQQYRCGDYIKIKGSLQKPSNNTNFNLFNYRQYLEYNHIYYLLKIDNYKLIKHNINPFYYLKNKVIDYIEKSQYSNSYLKTFILGNNDYLDSNIQNVYQKIGINHLFAISGMHIYLLTFLLISLLRKIHLKEKVIFVVMLPFLIFYMFLTSFIPSVVRASIFFILTFFNRLINNKMNLIDLALLTLSIMILINPFLIYNISFLYSSITSTSLIIFYKKINNHKNYFSKLLVVSIISFLVSLPISIYYFSQFNLLSIIYNIVFVPLISFIIYPFAIITFLIPRLDPIFFWLINILETLANIFSHIPTIIIMKKPIFLICLIYYSLIYAFLFTNNKKLLFFLIVLWFIHYHYNFFFKSNMVIMLDVGQGDSILLFSNNQAALIDTASQNNYSKDKWQLRNTNKSIVDNITIPLLKSLGIRKLDYLILTHGDLDHMGESINLVKNFKVNKVILNNDNYNDLEQNLIQVLLKEKIPYSNNIDRLKVGNYYLSFLNTRIYDNENDNSNVIYFKYNQYQFLFMGDAGIIKENDILTKYKLKNITFFKVGHHGSDTSSSLFFINTIKPQYSLISVGKNNRYGHPKKIVLKNLANSKIYRTDLDGSVMIKLKGNKYKIINCPP